MRGARLIARQVDDRPCRSRCRLESCSNLFRCNVPEEIMEPPDKMLQILGLEDVFLLESVYRLVDDALMDARVLQEPIAEQHTHTRSALVQARRS